MTFLHLLILSLALAVAQVRAAPPSPAMHAAIDKLVASQSLEAVWPAMVENSARTGAAKVEKGAREALDAMPELGPGQRARAYAVIAETAPRIAAEITALHRQLPVRELLTEMAYVVYPRYYTAQEIDELARHYGSPVFAKVVRFEMQVDRESARTGQSKDALFAAFVASLTAADKESLVAFGNSATGRKHRELGKAVSNDSRRFLQQRMEKDGEAVTRKYGLLMREKLAKALAPQ